LSQINPAHNTPSYFSIIHFNPIISSTSRFSYLLFLSGFPAKTLYAFLFPPKWYMHSSPHPPWPEYSDYILWRVQVMKQIIMSFSSAFYYSNALTSKYSPWHLVLRYLQSMVFLQCQKQNFTPIQNYKQKLIVDLLFVGNKLYTSMYHIWVPVTSEVLSIQCSWYAWCIFLSIYFLSTSH
jgi:hypothetical protein